MEMTVSRGGGAAGRGGSGSSPISFTLLLMQLTSLLLLLSSGLGPKIQSGAGAREQQRETRVQRGYGHPCDAQGQNHRCGDRPQ